ncbi:MAG: hypothetical protein ACSHXH_06350 [Marivita sp.]|uniref:hypothetical protein n=1 Tax=Marivita sp. TaxID=2003365 RepID=UPI003EFA6B63
MTQHRFGLFSVIATCVACALPFGAFAQGLEIEPIVFDPAPGSDSDVILAALPTTDAAPVLRDGSGTTRVAALAGSGLPQPSLILGMIAAGEEEAFGIERLLPATVQEIAFPLDDLTARKALRDRNPDLFRQLVEEGHVDPAPDQLNRVLQVELQRMNCYRSGIDGAWGPGSRGSVASYFEELETVSWPDQEPSNPLFRAILINGDVECPTPVVAAPAPRATPAPAQTTRSTSTTPRATTAAPTRRAQPAPQPAPQPQQPRLSIGGSGVFR